jgi:S1-C subfamily serine protease
LGGLLVALCPLLVTAGATAPATPPPSDTPEPGPLQEEEILRVAGGWKDRVFLVVADGGPCRVPVQEVLENPRALFRNRRVGCAVYVGHGNELLTTSSVVHGNTEVEIFSESGFHTVARVAGRDPYLDLALLVAMTELPEVGSLSPPEIASDPVPGSSCLVLGNAYGRSLSATLGTIGSTVEIMPTGLPIRVIRVEVPVFPGDSGGPILDGRGRFVGIVTAAIQSGSHPGLVLEGTIGEREIRARHAVPAGRAGFAVPAAQCERAWQDLRQHGRVRRGYLGVRMALDDGSGGGAHILGTLPNSPAEAVGIQPGDLIVQFGSIRITTPQQFVALVAANSPRTRLEIHLIRDRAKRRVSVELGEAGRPMGLRSLGTPSELGAAPETARTPR